jgi:HAD superfamily hydrolase (TIGR01509 family)
MPLRLMLFDLWGTLFIDKTAAKNGAARVEMCRRALRELGYLYDAAEITDAFARAAREHGGIHADGRDISAEGRTVLYLRHLDPTLANRFDDAAWDRLHRAVLTAALVARPAAMPGAVKALRTVKALGVPLGLVSNAGTTPGFVLREIMDGHGLLEHFDHTVFSDEVELSKPATAIFELALDAFGVSADAAAFVGDQPVLDVLGPQSAGIRAIQLGDLREDGITPDARIASLDELVPALRMLEMID